MSIDCDDSTSDLRNHLRGMRERQAAECAVRGMREKELSIALDELISLFDDSETLIARGEYTPERALPFLRKQAERCVELKDRLLSGVGKGRGSALATLGAWSLSSREITELYFQHALTNPNL